MKLLIALLIAASLLVATGSASVRLAFVDSKEDPGSIYSIDLETGTLTKIFTKETGRIYTLATNNKEIYLADQVKKEILETSVFSNQAKSIFAHSTNVRDIEVRNIQGNNTRIYFSDATGAGGNGMIYYLDSSGGAVPYYNVGYTLKFTDVYGYWDGYFAFDDENNLYLSNGNCKPSSIYKISGADPDHVDGPASKIYTDPDGPIMGMQFTGPESIYIASHGPCIYRLDLNLEKTNVTKREEVYKGNATWINDVSLIEGGSLNKSTGTFVGSSKSSIYHRPDCRWAKEIRPNNEVWFSSCEEAEAAGYKACKVCKPDRADSET
jgi:hypothetical protein